MSEKPVWEEDNWTPKCIEVHFEAYDPERDAARGRLAAAAPEMARLLLRFEALWSSIETCTPVDDAYRAAVVATRAALRKAGVRP